MTAARSASSFRIASATSRVGNGRKETAISSSRFRLMSFRSTYARRLKIPWWRSQIPPIVRKLDA